MENVTVGKVLAKNLRLPRGAGHRANRSAVPACCRRCGSQCLADQIPQNHSSLHIWWPLAAHVVGVHHARIRTLNEQEQSPPLIAPRVPPEISLVAPACGRPAAHSRLTGKAAPPSPLHFPSILLVKKPQDGWGAVGADRLSRVFLKARLGQWEEVAV